MASSKKGKMVVKKDDLRRLMKEKSKSTTTDGKKIDSPLAKYDSMGNLYCVVCSTKVKNHLVWNAHIMGRTHKQNVERLKDEQHKKATAPAPPPVQKPPKPKPQQAPKSILKNSTAKPKADVSAAGDANGKRGLPDDFFDSNSQKKPNLAIGNYGSGSESEPEEAAAGNVAPPPIGDLPSDFFDPGVKASTSVAQATTKKDDEGDDDGKAGDAMADKLPEGFFDDAKMDAKVREVEYKDKMEDEWAMFQKEIKTATIESEAIAEEESEVVQTNKDLQMVDEQIYRLQKVNELAKKKESTIVVTQKHKKQPVEEEESSDVDSDIEPDMLLDWRTKKV